MPPEDQARIDRALETLPPDIKSRIVMALSTGSSSGFLDVLEHLHRQLGDLIQRMREGQK